MVAIQRLLIRYFCQRCLNVCNYFVQNAKRSNLFQQQFEMFFAIVPRVFAKRHFIPIHFLQTWCVFWFAIVFAFFLNSFHQAVFFFMWPACEYDLFSWHFMNLLRCLIHNKTIAYHPYFVFPTTKSWTAAPFQLAHPNHRRPVGHGCASTWSDFSYWSCSGNNGKKARLGQPKK